MTSKIVVNNIEADAGVSTVTFNSNVVRGGSNLHSTGLALGAGSTVGAVTGVTTYYGDGSQLTGISQVGGATGADFNDNVKLRLGTGNDLEIFHNGSQSKIADTVGNELRINANTIRFRAAADDETYANFIDDGAVELYHNNVKKIETASGGISLTGGAAANITALSDGATITIDMATACHHSVTLGGNRTFAAPSNQAVGQAGSIFITQDGAGSRTAAFNSAFKFVGGTAPTLTTTASATDRIDYIIKSSNVIHCAVSLDVK